MKSSTNYAGSLSAPEFQNRLQSTRGVILVCGSCEQHGRHLPLDTDNIIGMELALRIAKKTDMCVLPPINYGQVWSAKGFPGTLSLSPATLKTILRDLVISLEKQGARHIVLMSGHNGNNPVFKEFAREMLDEFGWKNIWHFPITKVSKELLAQAKSPAPMVPHAGEIETALMLHLRPELVDMTKATCEFPIPPEDFPYRAIHWKDFVKTGSFGDGSAATEEYGKRLAEEAVETTADLINRFLL